MGLSIKTIFSGKAYVLFISKIYFYPFSSDKYLTLQLGKSGITYFLVRICFELIYSDLINEPIIDD